MNIKQLNLAHWKEAKPFLKHDIFISILIVFFAIITLIKQLPTFFGNLTQGTFVLSILTLIMFRNSKGLGRFILSLGRGASLISLLGVVSSATLFFISSFNIAPFPYISFIKGLVLLLVSIFQIYLIYSLFIKWSLLVNSNKPIHIKDYRPHIFLWLILYIGVILLSI